MRVGVDARICGTKAASSDLVAQSRFVELSDDVAILDVVSREGKHACHARCTCCYEDSMAARGWGPLYSVYVLTAF